MNEIIKMTATELASKIKNKELSSVEVTKAFIERIKEVTVPLELISKNRRD